MYHRTTNSGQGLAHCSVQLDLASLSPDEHFKFSRVLSLWGTSQCLVTCLYLSLARGLLADQLDHALIGCTVPRFVPFVVPLQAAEIWGLQLNGNDHHILVRASFDSTPDSPPVVPLSRHPTPTRSPSRLVLADRPAEGAASWTEGSECQRNPSRCPVIASKAFWLSWHQDSSTPLRISSTMASGTRVPGPASLLPTCPPV